MSNKNAQPIVEWRDLCAPNLFHSVLEIARPLMLCGAAVWALSLDLILVAGVLLLFGHIAALRSAHGAVHNTLGLPKWANQAVLYGVSGMLATSCHALDFTHTLHHRRCGAAEDVEGQIAHCSFWRACLISPSYHWRVIKAAWRLGSRSRRHAIIADLGVALVLHALLLWTLGGNIFWLWLGLAVLNGAGGLLSVWLFHRGGEVTRSGHWPIAHWLTMGMLYHGEHHLYPAVPTAQLSRLAKRLNLANASPAPLIQWSRPSLTKLASPKLAARSNAQEAAPC